MELDGEALRLNKLLKDRLLLRKRTIAELLASGRVTLSGAKMRPADAGRLLLASECRGLLLDGRPLPPLRTPVIVAAHKPRGMAVVLSPGERDRRFRAWLAEVAASLGSGRRELSAVGRLDKATTGLLLLTDDGDLDLALRESPSLLKAYAAVVAADATAAHAACGQLLTGVPLPDGEARAMEVMVMGSDDELKAAAQRPGLGGLAALSLPVAPAAAAPGGRGSRAAVLLRLADGRNRVVRRMLAAAGLPCLSLHRVAYGPLELAALGLLEPGSFRTLPPAEVEALRAAAAVGLSAGRAARVRAAACPMPPDG